MKKILLLFIGIIFIFNASISYSEKTVEDYSISKTDIQAKAAILIDANTGQILFDKNIHEKLYPASTTKLLTALIIVEDLSLSDQVIIDKDSPFTGGSRIYVEEGEKLTVEQLLNALLVESANDTAAALAIYHSGSLEDFAKVMNKKAKELGALNSNFVTPHGLPNKKHITTAYDLAQIAKNAYSNDIIRSIVKKSTYTIPPTNKVSETRYLKSSNKFLYSRSSNYLLNYRGKKIFTKYDLINGMKTGYTDAAGNCLISSAKKGNRELISVVLKSPGKNVYIDSRKLIDYGLYEFDEKTYFKKGEGVKRLQLNNFKKSKIKALAKNDVKVLLEKNYDISKLSTEISINDLKLPIEKGSNVGSYNILYNDRIISSIDLVSNIRVDNSILLDDKTQFYDKKSKLSLKIVLTIFLKLVIAFFIWRLIITLIRLKFEKKNNIYS